MNKIDETKKTFSLTKEQQLKMLAFFMKTSIPRMIKEKYSDQEIKK